jgi:glyoxylase-like metal-dependent hydrolase (beta-lactamase superfamily II)
LLTGNADDSAALRHDFARRAGLDAAASELFAEHSRGYRRGVPSVPSSFQRLADGQLVEIGGRQWRVIIGEVIHRSWPAFIAAETGVLIAGDQVLPRISPNISVHAHEPDGDPLSRFLRSLEKLRAVIPPETLVLPSHNLPFFGLQERVDELAAHHKARCEEVIAACQEPRTAVELLPVLFRRPLDRHQTAFALGEALAHLHYLMGQGALARMLGADGANRFVRADG